MNKENKQLIISVIAFLIVNIVLFLTIATAIKNSNNSNSNEVTEPVEETTEAQTDDTVENTLKINKVMLDTEELYIELLDAKSSTEKDKPGVVINTLVKNNIDNRITIDAVNEYLNNANANLSYYFTMEKQEEAEKELFIPVNNMDNLKIEFNINVSDSLEQTLLYQSGKITLHFDAGELTVIKSSSLESKINEQATEPIEQVETEETQETDPVESVEETEGTVENNETTDDGVETEEYEPFSWRDKEEPEEVDVEAIENGKTTVVGDNRFGFYTLPGEFTLVEQDGNYTEYKSADLIEVSFNYREDTTVDEFKSELILKYIKSYPGAKFKEVKSRYINAKALKETGEIIIKNDETGGLENYTEDEIVNSGFTYRIYKYQVASNSGNYIMLTTTSPNPDDIVTIGILVPYELTGYFSEFVNKVVDSYEFIQ